MLDEKWKAIYPKEPDPKYNCQKCAKPVDRGV